MNLLDELIQYSNDCIAHPETNCQKHRWACARFLRDLERSKADDPDFPYYFDEAKAERFFNWMRLFKHRKGVLKGKNIEPHISQKFDFGNVFGWIHKETGYRRFNKFYLQIARKNAKSQDLACVGTYETMADIEGETCEVYCAATKTEQAKIVYDEAAAMLESCALLKGKFEIKYGRIVHKKTGSFMRPLSEEDRKTGDGTNPQCGIVDEYHAHETAEMYDVIDSGMGARTQPILGIITTAGFELNNPCYRVEYDLVSKILNPNSGVTLDSYFADVYELDRNETAEDIIIGDRKIPPGEMLDDIDDEDAWKKANPIICSYPEGVEYLRKKVKEAKEAPEKLRNLYTKHFDFWVKMRESGYMNMDKWALCRRDFPDLRGKTCFVGGDLSSKIDLTSVGFEFFIDDVYLVKSHSFMPEETMLRKMKTDKVPYDLWEKDGWLTLLPGSVIDYRKLKEYIIDESKKNGWAIREICLDPWGTSQLAGELTEEGYTTVDIVQGIKTLSEPTKDFRNMVYSGRIAHDGNPVLSWAMSNAIIDEPDKNLNAMLNKKKSVQRIDPVAALLNAHVRCMVKPEESIYEKRGMLSLD